MNKKQIDKFLDDFAEFYWSINIDITKNKENVDKLKLLLGFIEVNLSR